MAKDKNEFENLDFKSLTDFGVDVRYPDDFYVPGVPETLEYVQIAKNVKEIIYRKINIILSFGA